jgi:hypothetical protein
MSESGFSLGNMLIDQLAVCGSGLNGFLPSSDFVFLVDSLSSKSNVGDQSLNLGGFLSEGGSWVLLALESSSGDVFLDQGCGNGLIFFLSFDSVELSDVVGSLGTQSSWDGGVGDARDFLLTFLDDGD